MSRRNGGRFLFKVNLSRGGPPRSDVKKLVARLSMSSKRDLQLHRYESILRRVRRDLHHWMGARVGKLPS